MVSANIRRVLIQVIGTAYRMTGFSNLLRRQKWVIFVVAAAGLGWLLLEPLLSAATNSFRCDDRFEEADITHLYMMGGDRILEATMEMAANGKPILLSKEWAPRSVQCGAAPSSDDIVPNLLQELGATPDQLVILPGRPRDRYKQLRFLSDWLSEHPDAMVCILTDALASGGLRRMIDRELVESEAAQVKIKPLETTEYSSKSWWRSRAGCKAFYGHAVGRFYSWLAPAGPPVIDDLSPQEYENAFRQRLHDFGVKVQPVPTVTTQGQEPLQESEPSTAGAI